MASEMVADTVMSTTNGIDGSSPKVGESAPAITTEATNVNG
jgi:hypothetical protein